MMYACQALVNHCNDLCEEFRANSSVEVFIFSDRSLVIIDRKSRHVTVCDKNTTEVPGPRGVQEAIKGRSSQFSQQLLSDLQDLIQSNLLVVKTQAHGLTVDIEDGKLCIRVEEV